MNDNGSDFERNLEADVRAELRRTIVPPATPTYLRERVELMAEHQIEGAGRRRSLRPSLRSWFLGGAFVARLGVTAVVLAVLAGTAFTLSRNGGPGSGSAPAIGPARGDDPAATSGPTFPPNPVSPGGKTVTLLDTTPDGGVFVRVEGEGMRVSTDSGVTWSENRPLPVDGYPLVDFVDAAHGWVSTVTHDSAAAHVDVSRTSDGGRTWQTVRIADLTAGSGPLPADAWAHFRDLHHGQVYTRRLSGVEWKSTDCRMYTTDDGGSTWSGPVDAPCVVPSWNAQWVNASVGLTDLPDSKSVAITRDGGRTWTAGTIPVDPSEVGWQIELLESEPGLLRVEVAFTPRNGADFTDRHAVYDSSDSGATWSKAYDAAAGDTQVVSTFGRGHWLALTNAHTQTDSQLVRTDDGGRSWYLVASVLPSWGGTMHWWDARRGVTQSPDPCPGAGGPAAQSPGAEYSGASSPGAASPRPESTGAPCSSHSTVFVTNDGGRTWHQVPF
jgi:hypothetical protein